MPEPGDRMSVRFLTALPVYNEARHVSRVLDEVVRFSPDVLVVNDGSTDATSRILAQRDDIRVISHETNLGYGAALRTALDYSIDQDFDVVVTIDCDGQHEPQRIDQFVAASATADIVSGSRYLQSFSGDSPPPEERRQINRQITQILNERFGLKLTDAFCGFKAYRTSALARLKLSEPGYGMPIELWVQAADRELTVVELPVPLIYLEEERSFGGALDDGGTRMEYYRRVLDDAVQATQRRVDPDGENQLARAEGG